MSALDSLGTLRLVAALGVTPEVLDWMSDGLCREVDAETFFPEQGGAAKAPKLICRGCDVLEECREWALERELTGVWGGLAEYERQRIQKARHGAALAERGAA